MIRACFSLVAIAVLICISAATGYGVVIGNFEGGTTDGWDAAFNLTQAGSGLFPDNSPGFGAAAATTGTYALNLYSPPVQGVSNNFRWSMVLDNNDIPTLGALLISNPLLKMDVTWIHSEWEPSPPSGQDWAKWDTVAVNDTTGWEQTGGAQISDTGNPGFPGSWDATGFPGVHKRTITHNLSAMSINPGGFIQLYLSINYAGQWPATPTPVGGSFWIDNIRLEAIPEPTSITLAGIGILAAFRGLRRKVV